MTTELGADPSMRTYLAILRQQRWWVLGATILGLAAGIAFSVSQQPQYTATAQVLVRGIGISTVTGVAQQPVTSTDVLTEMQLVTSAPVRQAVQHLLGSTPDVAASEVGQTNVIAISATAADPAWAARVANAYAQSFVIYQQTVSINSLVAVEDQLRSQISGIAHQIKTARGNAAQVSALVTQEAVLKEQLAQMQVSAAVSSQNVQLVTPALLPTLPSSPGPRRDGGLGLGAGLLLGIAVAFLRDALNDTLKSKEAAEELAGAPVLGQIPLIASWKRRDRAVMVSRSEPTSAAAEAYRSLRTSLQFIRQERELRTILVTSATASEGKTATVANLGMVFAQAGERVVLVSCDLRRPRIGQFLGVEEQHGFTSILLGQDRLREMVQPVPGQQNLWILGAGPIPPNPAELLNGPAAEHLIKSLRGDFDLVLVDSPPLLPVTDAAVLSKIADGTLLIAATGQTRQGDLRRTAEKLNQLNAPVVGLVLNQLTKQAGHSYGYGYGRGYGYGYGYKPYISAPTEREGSVLPNGKVPPESISNQ